MATEEWARSLNDATLRHELNGTIQRLREAHAEVARWTQRHDVVLAEYRRRREEEAACTSG